MSISNQLLVFHLDAQRYAISLTGVMRVIPAVEITVLPNAPVLLLGVINVAGTILPVLNLRRRFRLEDKAVSPSDQFLIVRTRQQTVVLVIDHAAGVIEQPIHDVAETAGIVPGIEHVQGLIKLPDGLVLLHDLEKILSVDEARSLEETIMREVVHGA